MNDDNFKPIAFVDANKDFKEAFDGKRIIKTEFCTNHTYQFSSMDEAIETHTEGGLTFTLEDNDSNVTMVVLGYTELGEWIAYNGGAP